MWDLPDSQLTIIPASSTGRCNTLCIKLFSSKVLFSDVWEMCSAYSHERADLMRCFEARLLLREIDCALGNAYNVFHLKGVLH
jgi:hypothetical protein